MTFRASYKPQLAKSSLILPSTSGWVIQIGSKTIDVRSKTLASASDTILDLLDGRHTLAAITRHCGAPLGDLRKLCTRLSRLHLLETGTARVPGRRERRPSLKVPSPAKPVRSLKPLLLVGLGDLGLTALDQLLQLQCRPRVIFIFDPSPVDAADVGTFYRPSDVGRMKVDVVLRRLGSAGQSIVKRASTEGRDWEAIQKTLAHVMRRVLTVVCCLDSPSYLAEWVSEICTAERVPLVVAELIEAGGSIGPIRARAGAGESGGCIACTSLYRSEGNSFGMLAREYLRQRFPHAVRWRPSVEPWLIETISRLTLLAALQADDRSDPATKQSMLWQVNSDPFEVISSAVPSHYACAQCFPATGRTSSELRKHAIREWRQHWDGPAIEPMDLLELRSRSQHFVGERFALFRTCQQESADQRRAVYRFCSERGANPRNNLVANAFRAVVMRPRQLADGGAAYAEGSDFYDGRKAEALALMEGIERLFALEQRDSRSVVAASYQAVAGHALDPATFPLYAEDQYAQRGFGLTRFAPEQSIEWIWGVRISDSEPVLAPMDLVFSRRQGPKIYRANSNGAACHSSFHHAVLGGIYETIERDALMVAWMNRLSLPVLESSGADAGVRRDLAALSLELTCVDLTTDLEIPVQLGILRDQLNPDFLLVNPVAALLPQQLDQKLERELTQFCRPYLSDRHCYTNRVSTSSDPQSVKKLPDHLAFYQNRKKIKHACFLWACPERKAEMHAMAVSEALDIKKELSIVVDRLARRGYEVIVVDCSVPLIRDLGLHAVKVLIPGLQPLHAGYRYAALGGERLYQVPRLMGLAGRDRSRGELNPWPHPFW